MVRGGSVRSTLDGSSGALGCNGRHEVLLFLEVCGGIPQQDTESARGYAETKGQRQTVGPHGSIDAIGNGEKSTL